MTLYIVGALVYLIYGYATDFGLIHYWMILVKFMELRDLFPHTRNLVAIFGFFVVIPAMALCLPPYYAGIFITRRWAPEIARAMSSWGEAAGGARVGSVPTWSSTSKVVGWCVLLVGIAAGLVHCFTESVAARRIYSLDLRGSPASSRPKMKHVRISGVVLQEYRLVWEREDGTDQQSVVPLVGASWKKGDPIPYLLVGAGDTRRFNEAQDASFAGDTGSADSRLEATAINEYNSRGLKVNWETIFVRSANLPAADLVPVSYDSAITVCGLGAAIITAIVLVDIKQRADRK